MMGGAMETVFWVIAAIVVLAVAYVCTLSFGKRKEVKSEKEQGVDLQARRKTFDDLT